MSKPNKLWTVLDGGATYWVSAPTEHAAKRLVAKLPDRDDNVLEAVETSYLDKERLKFRFDDGETCKLGNAFELVRAHVEILSCSEWP